MADLNPMVPGDVPYPQYSVVTTMDVPLGDTIVKGRIYTANNSGFLVTVSTSLVGGMFQAMADSDAVAGETVNRLVQVLGPRSRIILESSINNIGLGSDVRTVANTITVDQGPKSDDLYIGKTFEIYTKNLDSTKKLQADTGDLLIVETVQA